MVVDFKPRFRVQKSNIKTIKERCHTSRHLNERCLCSTSPFGYVKVQIIEQVYLEDHQQLKKCFSMEKDAVKIKYLQLPMGWTVSMTFTAKSVKEIGRKSLSQLLHSHLSTFGHSLLLLIIYFPIIFF